MANGNNAAIGFEKQIWDAACVLWGHIPAAEYRKVIVGLIFLRYISNAFEKRYQELVAEGDGFEDDRDAYAEDNIFFVPEDARWSKIASAAHTPEIGTLIDNAMRAIEAENKSLKNVLPKNYASPDLDKRVLGDVVDLFTNMDMSDTKENKDLLGKTYQYCIQQFAAYEGVKGGEFYTPASIVKTIVAILKPFKNCRVYDPCCGSGGMFVQSLKFVDRHNGNRQKVSIIGQESNPDTWRLCKMNLAIRGIAHNLGDTNASTFTNDLHKDKTVDYIMANPPFNLKGWRAEDALTDDPRFMRAGYSVMPPVANANYAWILHMLSKLDVNHGVAGFLLANGALNIGDAEGTLRREILERDRVEAIIVLPRDMFYTTDISVTLWIVNMNKKAGTVNGRQLRDRTHEVLFMDLRQWDENVEEIVVDKGKKKKKTVLTDSQISKVKETYSNWQSVDTSLYSDIPEYCRSVKLKNADLSEDEKKANVTTIESMGYSLAPSKYIEFIDHDLEIDYESEMLRIQNEMKSIISLEEKSISMLKDAFKGIGYEI